MTNKNKILFAIVYSLAVSLSENIFVLASACVAAMVLFRKKFLSALLRLNTINIIAIITLALTWPDPRGGILTGLLIALRVNVIYIVLAAMVFPMGFAGLYQALVIFKVPEKLKILILLTLRGIFVLRERFNAALISLKLRAPKMKIKSFTCVTGSVILQAAARAERMERAIKCRGGFGGFSSVRSEELGFRNENAFNGSQSLLSIS
ncbi:MAG: hypothetical protein IJU31_02705 [Synergistaceae bacterium]|nr:hypothetical protein [Synergistaceae bacterium]